MIKSITFVGPFATEYSLAKVNRALALAVHNAYPEIKVRLWGTAETIDRLPGKSEYERYPFLKELYEESPAVADVAIFNNFPKNPSALFGLKDLPGKIKLAYLAWEETVFPKRWVDEINENLHGMLVTSTHVARILRRSGVSVPVQILQEGLDIPFTKTENLKIPLPENFKFLHISSGQYRKGVDVLLKAFFQEFSSQDKVSLVLKLFPNASAVKEIDQLLAAKPQNAPQIVVIKDATLTDGQLKDLYEKCDAVVLPSRAEGFGLPMAEAMELGKPLITTDYSGHMDFCSAENAFLISHKLVESASHLNLHGSFLAEPDLDSLRKQLRFVYENATTPKVTTKVELAKKAVAHLRWENAAKELHSFIETISEIAPLKEKSICVVSTWNSFCGIAEYSHALYNLNRSAFKKFTLIANSDIGDRTAPDEDYVIRLWQYGEMDFKSLTKYLATEKPDIVHFQYNLSFYSPVLLGQIVTELSAQGMECFVTLHSVMPVVGKAQGLKAAKKLFVHSEADRKELEDYGFSNVRIVDHGLPDFQDTPTLVLREKFGITNTPVITSHGLIHDKKGILETLAAIKILKKDYPEILFLSINAVNPNNATSASVFQKMQEFVKAEGLETNVMFFKDFLSLPEIYTLIHLGDITVLAYGDIKEGASGAVRTCIAAMRPLLITNSYIFSNLQIGERIPDNSPENIAAGIKKMLQKNEGTDALKHYIGKHTWEAVSRKHLQEII